MKKLLLVLPLLSLISLAQAQSDFCATDTVSFGVGPDGVCAEFQSSCIPADYKRVPSCGIVEDPNRNSSLESRLRALFQSRLNSASAKAEAANQEVKAERNAKSYRLGRSDITRNFSAPVGEQPEDEIGSDRTFTSKDFDSVYRRHNLKGGFDRGQKSTGHRTSYQRPSFTSRVRTTSADETISATPKWSVTTQDHFREKSYGTNPYSLSSVRAAEQREYREDRAANQRVDIKGRILSNSRKWRPSGVFGQGNLSGDADFLKLEAEKKSEVIEDLNAE